jgi:hypothetical protein
MPEHTVTLKAYDCPILIQQNLKKNEDSIEIMNTRKQKIT